jgi:DNA polymerase
MAKVLDQETSAAVSARLRYYRELGIFDLYRREVPPELQAQLESNSALAEAAAPAGEISTSNPITEPVPPLPKKIRSTAATDHAAALRVIREDLGDCTRCKLHEQGRKQIVFGVGDPDTRLMFVGEGPGADEDEQGEPFVGKAGQLLNNMIYAMNLERAQVYIGNVVKCRPPQNRTPERDECETCSPFLMRQIAVIRPEVIVALGATAAKTLLGVTDSMAKLRGKVYDFSPVVARDLPEHDSEYSAKLVVTYHPAYLLRDPRQKGEAWKDLQIAMGLLGLTARAKA